MIIMSTLVTGLEIKYRSWSNCRNRRSKQYRHIAFGKVMGYSNLRSTLRYRRCPCQALRKSVMKM